MDIIESLKCQVDASEDIHGLLSGACCMTVATLYTTLHLARLKPYPSIKIEYGEIIEGHLSIPSSKDVHVVLVDYCCVAESNLRFHKKTKLIRKLAGGD